MEHCRHRHIHTITVDHRGQLGQPHTVTELWRQHRRGLHSEAGLADATHTDQRHHTMSADGVDDGGDGVVTSDETGFLHRQVAGHHVDGAQ